MTRTSHGEVRKLSESRVSWQDVGIVAVIVAVIVWWLR